MEQRSRLLDTIHEFCNKRMSRTFGLQELYDNIDYKELQISGDTPDATVRRLLQELRDTNHINFHEERGMYTLIEPNNLEGEGNIITQQITNPDKKEYILEAYARNKGWVRLAKEKFGLYCLYPECNNTFKKEDGTPYIEVHHIVPLYQNGEDGIWNLSVVCAHHHRMAHFADAKTKSMIQGCLQKITHNKLTLLH